MDQNIGLELAALPNVSVLLRRGTTIKIDLMEEQVYNLVLLNVHSHL